MKKENKAQTILYFLCSAIWLVCLIFDIVEKEFSTQFYLHIACVVLFAISGFVALKGRKEGKQEDKKE